MSSTVFDNWAMRWRASGSNVAMHQHELQVGGESELPQSPSTPNRRLEDSDEPDFTVGGKAINANADNLLDGQDLPQQHQQHLTRDHDPPGRMGELTSSSSAGLSPASDLASSATSSPSSKAITALTDTDEGGGSGEGHQATFS